MCVCATAPPATPSQISSQAALHEPFASTDQVVSHRAATRSPGRYHPGLCDECLADIAQLYAQDLTYSEIAAALSLSVSKVHRALSHLFAEGMPHRPIRCTTDAQIRAIHAAYIRGEASIAQGAATIGFTGSALRRQMRRLDLQLRPRKRLTPVLSSAESEQRVTATRFTVKDEERRRSPEIPTHERSSRSGVHEAGRQPRRARGASYA